MRPIQVLLWLCLSLLVTGAVACSAGTQSSLPQPAPSPTLTVSISNNEIQYVIILVQENRTTDDLFHGLAGADTATSGWTSNRQNVTLQPVPLKARYDINHEHNDFLHAYDHAKMDGFDLEGAHTRGTYHIPPDPEYAYVPESDVAPYFTMAERFTFADRMFQSNQGPSFPAHQFLVGGTSTPRTGSTLLASGSPLSPGHVPPIGGCDSPPGTIVGLIDPNGDQDYSAYPCFDHKTLMDLLDAKNISWAYYEPYTGGYWDGPDAISHIRQTPADWARVIVPETTILTDITAGTLPQVSWVIPNGPNSDHPGSGNGGPSWVASIVNAVGQSPYWNSTAIFVTWDDWGGWYDHVVPPVRGSYELGFRVPLMVISPYAKAGYVSHKTHEFGSILRFVEDNWLLGSTGYTDSHTDDLSDCFDFTQTPIPFMPIQAPYPASHFLGAHVFSPPDND